VAGGRRRLATGASRVLFAALVATQLRYPYVRRERQTAATRAVVGLMLAASVADLAAHRGARRAGVLAAVAAGVGSAAELCGVATGRPFGRYRYSRQLGPRVAGMPVLAPAAWAMMAFPAWSVAGLLTRRRSRRVPLAAAALTAWDAFLDPRMVREGYWTWEARGRYEGVPASNFGGWLLVGGALFAAWAALDGDGPPSDGALGLYAWTWAAETVANLLFWRRPRVAAVGGAAMGAFLVPALARRLVAHGVPGARCSPSGPDRRRSTSLLPRGPAA
jgi:putative membrane protein